jgi:hypothetical protein
VQLKKHQEVLGKEAQVRAFFTSAAHEHVGKIHATAIISPSTPKRATEPNVTILRVMVEGKFLTVP